MASPEAMQNYAISMPHIILLIEIYLSIFKCLLRAWLTPQCSKYAGSVLREVACLHPHEGIRISLVSIMRAILWIAQVSSQGYLLA